MINYVKNNFRGTFKIMKIFRNYVIIKYCRLLNKDLIFYYLSGFIYYMLKIYT